MKEEANAADEKVREVKQRRKIKFVCKWAAWRFNSRLINNVPRCRKLPLNEADSWALIRRNL